MRGGRLVAAAALAAACASCRAPWARRRAWTFHDEEYSCTTAGMSLRELKSAGVSLVSHTPCTREFFDEAHALGLRAIPYVSLYKVVDSSENPAFLKHPFWRELDLVEHPGWALIRPDGKRRRPFDNPNYSRGLHQSCCNAPGIHEAYLRGIKACMDLGADGVFVDNVHPYPKCYGVERAVPGHTHVRPDADNTTMYKAALKKVYDLVKSYGPDKVVMLNSGGPKPDYGALGDVLMWESYICSWAWENRRPDWQGVLRGARKWAPYIRSGKAIAPLAYLVKTPWGQLDDAYYTHACAKLGQFHWTATSDRKHVLRLLHRARLGQPAGPIAEAGGITYRLYERGLVAVNPTDEPLTAALPRPTRCEGPTDLYSGALLAADRQGLRLAIPPESGRVVLGRRAVAASFLEEVRLAASETRRRIRELGAERQPQADAARLVLEQLERLADQAAHALDDLPKATRILAPVPALLDRLPDPAQADSPAKALFAPDKVRTEADALALLRSLASPAEPRVAIEPDAIRLSSGGAHFELRPERKMLRLPGGAASFWASRGGKGKHGWRHPARFENPRLITDTPDRKVVAVTVHLRGGTSGELDTLLVLELEAEARRGLPGLFTRARVRNRGPEASVYAFWNVPGRFATTLGPDTHPLKGWGKPRGGHWVFVHRSTKPAPGVLVLKPTNAADGAGQFNVFAAPKTQTLARDAAMLIGAGFAPIDGVWLTDKSIVRHLADLRRFVPRALAILSGVELSATARTDIVAGVAAPIALRLLAHDETLAEAPATFALELPEGWRARPRPARSDEEPVTFLVSAPADARGRHLLAARARTKLADGTPIGALAELQAVVRSPVEVAAAAVAADRPGRARLRVSLRSFAPVALEADLRVALPKGWKGQTTAAGLQLPPNATTTATLALEAPSGQQAAVEAVLTIRKPAQFAGQLRSTHQVAVAPLVHAERVTQPPSLDGRLDDPCWHGAEPVTGFVDHKTGKPVREQTTARLAWDDRYLYAAFDCRESQMKLLRATVRPGDRDKAQHVPRDDSVELYLDTAFARQAAIQFAVNALGATKSRAAIPFEAAASRRSDGWSVELRIPFDKLRATPKVGGCWGINLCRNQWRLREFSAWSCPYGAYSNPQRLGIVLFEDKIH